MKAGEWMKEQTVQCKPTDRRKYGWADAYMHEQQNANRETKEKEGKLRLVVLHHVLGCNQIIAGSSSTCSGQRNSRKHTAHAIQPIMSTQVHIAKVVPCKKHEDCSLYISLGRKGWPKRIALMLN